MEENHFSFSTTEWKDIRDYIKHCLGICLSDRKTLDLVSELVTKIDECLIDCKEFQAGYHDTDLEPPPEMPWGEFCLVNGKEMDGEVEL